MEIINCVSRGYAENFGLPKTIEDLKDHQLIGYSTKTFNQPAGFEYNTEDGIRYVAMPHLVFVSTTNAYMASCLAGLGIVQIPKVGVQAYVNSEELIEILPDYRCLPMPVSILYVSRQYMPHKISIFIEWLTSIFNQFNESTPL